MTKKDLILKYFQKADQLTVTNQQYTSSISSLFLWLIDNDKIEADRTAKYFPNKNTKAIIMAKQDGIIAGLAEVEYLLTKHTKLVFKPKTKDGSGIKNKETIAEIRGTSHEILAYERTILNILQRMSGIATETNKLVNKISQWSMVNGQMLHIAATRKTPWMSLDKKAVAVGGGLTHRLSLSDGILIKDNHLKLMPIKEILPMILKKLNNSLIEIEVTSEKEASVTLSLFQPFSSKGRSSFGRNHINHLAILLDNFTPQDTKKTIIKLQKEFDLTDVIFEGSGGISRENIQDWAASGVDFISLGSLTHSAKALNLSLEF